eukprot:9813213-Karenia_brevis.AAC.1
MLKNIEELKAELDIQTSLLKTLQTQCALFTDLLGEHMFGHLPTSHSSPVLFDGHESFAGAATAGHAAPVLFDLFDDEDNNNDFGHASPVLIDASVQTDFGHASP